MTVLDEINATLATGDYQKALSLIISWRLKDNLTEECRLNLLAREIEILHMIGEPQKCDEKSKEFFKVLETKPITEYLEQTALVLYYYINNLINMGRLSDCIEHLKLWSTKPKYKQLRAQHPVFEAVYWLAVATVNNVVNLNVAEEAIIKCNQIAKNFEDQTIYAIGKFREGRIYAHKGEIGRALEVLNQSLKYGELLGNYYILASSYNAIGEIYRLKGDFGKALQYYNEALIIYQMNENKFGITNIYNNVGIVYYSRNDFDSALAYFTKSIEYSLAVGFGYITAESTYYIVRILLFDNKINEAKKYLEIIREANKKEKNKFIDFYTKLCEAIYFRAINRFKSFSAAQAKLEYILRNNEIYNEINIHAMLNLSELLIFELRVTGEQEIISELEKLAEQLMTIAKKTLSRSLLAETYWLRGKLSLLENKIDEALDFLSEAEKIATKQELQNLAYRIKADYSAIRKELSRWQTMLKEDSSLEERITQTAVDELIKNMIKRASYELESAEYDKPVMVLIVGDNGIPLYNYNFTSTATGKDALLSGFISALNSILAEFFGATGSLKRIEHQDYILLFQSIEKIGVCYIYQGGTFSAKKKIEKFIERIKNSYLDDLLQALNSGKMLESKKIQALNLVVQKIFVETKM